MAKQKPGVYDRVLECAKEEFLSKGFLDASLRTIAQEGTSTGSIPALGIKGACSAAIVEPVVDSFRRASTSWTTRLRRRRWAGTARHQMDLRIPGTLRPAGRTRLKKTTR